MTLKILPLLFLLLALSGCAVSVRDTGYLDQGYSDFNVLDEQDMKLRLDTEALHRVYIGNGIRDPETIEVIQTANDDDATTRALVFVVDQPVWDAPPIETEIGDQEEEILFTIRERLYRYLLRAYPHPKSSRDYDKASGNRLPWRKRAGSLPGRVYSRAEHYSD